MYILDTSNYRVLKWQVGEPLGYVVAGGNGNGGGFNQIGASYQLFVDDQYNVYVSDNAYHRVTKWTSLNSTWGSLVRYFQEFIIYIFFLFKKIAGGNGAGNTPEKLNNPWGIYVDSTNGLYVVDRANHRVQYWSAGKSHKRMHNI